MVSGRRGAGTYVSAAVFEVSARQRRSFRRLAAGLAAAGVLFVLVARPWEPRRLSDTNWSAAGAGVILLLLSVYYVRLACGWVVIADGTLRTSRLIRGRHVEMADIRSVATKTYRSRTGAMTIAQVRTKEGRTYGLPAPRTTLTPSDTDADFLRDIGELTTRVASNPGG